MPFAERGGGLYVSGTSPFAGELARQLERVPDEVVLRIAADHVSTTSDPVAQLVLAHQLHGQNLIARAHQEALLGKRSRVEDELLRYLLFVDEAPLNAAIDSAGPFAQQFLARGPHDSNGRSLRELDLRTRTFKYRLSYLVNTPQLAALPDDVKQRLFTKLTAFLDGEDPAPDFAQIPRGEREAIREILAATNPGYAAFVKTR